GIEDMHADMDFKVAGTKDGITALQMDIKIKGLTHEIMAQALEQAREARLFVLDKMLAVLPRPRTEMSDYAPRITTILINPDKIRDIIGPGGKMIRKISQEAMAVALASPPPAPREGGFGGRDRGGRNGGGRDRRPRRD